MTQVKAWHAPHKTTVAAGVGPSYLYAPLGMDGEVGARKPGDQHRPSADFREDGPSTSSQDVAHVPSEAKAVAQPPAPPTTKPGASAEMAEHNLDHTVAQDRA